MNLIVIQCCFEREGNPWCFEVSEYDFLFVLNTGLARISVEAVILVVSLASGIKVQEYYVLMQKYNVKG